MRAVILAGGKGTRLAPYTNVFPKPLVPIGDMPIDQGGDHCAAEGERCADDGSVAERQFADLGPEQGDDAG